SRTTAPARTDPSVSNLARTAAPASSSASRPVARSLNAVGSSRTTPQASASGTGNLNRTIAQGLPASPRRGLTIPTRTSAALDLLVDAASNRLVAPTRSADSRRSVDPPASSTHSSHVRRSSSGSLPLLALSKSGSPTADMRASDVSKHTPPTTKTLLSALQTKYSALEERPYVLGALHVLENAEEYGFDPEQDGDAGFLAWLACLEGAIPDLEDPDKSGISFGHDEIGTWRYHDALKDRITFGSIRNARRVLSAVLRIWAIAKEERDNTGSGPQPLVKLHIQKISECIEAAFKTDFSSSQPLASETPSLAADRQATSATAESSRGRGAVELKKGIVTETSLKSLGKAALIEILGHASKPFDKVERKESLLGKMVAGVENGTIVLTVTQVKCAKAGLPIPDVKDIKGTRKAKTT
ncbi:hypothetical protein CF336_g9264, partial [Tilletia laevis]